MGMLEEVSTYLASAGHGTVGTNLFLDFMPDTPSSCVGLFIAPSQSPDETFRTLPTAHNQALVVEVRDPSHSAAETLAFAIWTTLHGIVDTTLSGVLYHRVTGPTPYLAERDSARNWIFTSTYSVKRRIV